MVVPQGWNVTEPLGLAIRLYRITEQLKNAPVEAGLFIARIRTFSSALHQLQMVLESAHAGTPSIDGLQALESIVVDSQRCVQRCENFVTRFFNLVNKSGVEIATIGEAANWVWKKEEGRGLAAEMDTHIQAILLRLGIENFARLHSSSTPPRHNQTRSETFGTLPPYSSPNLDPQRSDHQVPQGIKRKPVKPSEILGIDLNSHHRQHAQTNSLLTDVPSLPSRIGSSGEPPVLGPLSRPSSFSLCSAPKASSPLSPDGHHPSAILEAAASPESTSRRSTLPSRKPSSSATLAKSLMTSPELGSCHDIAQARRDSFPSLDEIKPEILMNHLRGTFVSFVRRSQWWKIPVEDIQAFSLPQTNRRYIVLHSANSSTKYYLKYPIGRSLIPHVEHPLAHASRTVYQVTFQERVEFLSERASSRRQSGASFNMADMPTEASSAASIRSISSIGSTTSGTWFIKEPSQPEFDFANFDDCRDFQNLVIGQGIKLVTAPFPVKDITSTRSKADISESKSQCLRLWQRGSFQYLMYFANLTSGTYQEYRMDCLKHRPGGSKRRLELAVQVPDCLAWQASKTNCHFTDSAHQSPEITSESGLTKPIDLGHLRSLKTLIIEFSDVEEKTRFLQHAKF